MTDRFQFRKQEKRTADRISSSEAILHKQRRLLLCLLEQQDNGRSDQCHSNRSGNQLSTVAVQPCLHADRHRATIEASVRTKIFQHGLHQIVRPIAPNRLTRLLRPVASSGEVAVDQARKELVRPYRSHGGNADKLFVPVMVGRPVDRTCHDLGLIDRRHRLRLVGHARPDPFELRRVDCGKMHHVRANIAPVVDQLEAQRTGKALDRMLGDAICRLQRDRVIYTLNPLTCVTVMPRTCRPPSFASSSACPLGGTMATM